MQMETKFLRLRTPVELGSRFGDWQVCWLGGWARFRLHYLVMLVKVPFGILLDRRRIDLAFGEKRAMNGVAMNTFTIDTNNNITAFASLDEARAAKIHNAEYFGSREELAKLVASWPRTRPVEIWNSFAGVAPFTAFKPVKKFADRKSAVARIWEAVQVLPANVAKPATHVAPEKRTEQGRAEVQATPHSARWREGSGQCGPRGQQEGRGNRSDAPSPGGNAFRNHGTDGLAGAHGTRLRQRDAHQETWVECRVLPLERKGAHIPR